MLLIYYIIYYIIGGRNQNVFGKVENRIVSETEITKTFAESPTDGTLLPCEHRYPHLLCDFSTVDHPLSDAVLSYEIGWSVD